MTIKRVQSLLDVSHRTASLMVTRLVKEKILYPLPGQERNRQFRAQEILNLLDTENPEKDIASQ